MELATFDTLTAAAALRKAGIEEAHAAAIVQTVRSAVTEGVSTKADVASPADNFHGQHGPEAKHTVANGPTTS